jgi:putative ABC transport system permease protein
MLKNYLKSAIRFLKQNKVFAAINALGLSIALAASFIILLFVINELSYNHFHKKRDRVFRVLNYNIDLKTKESGTPYILASALKEQFPQIEKAIMARSLRGFKLKLQDEYLDVYNAISTESDVFDIFTIQMISGKSNQNLLEDQSSLILSRDLANKFFPGQDPTGKEIIGLVDNEEHVFKVKGVFENIPENSTFKAQCFINSRWTLAGISKTFNTNADKDWNMNFWNTWVLVSKNSNIKSIENQFRAFEVKNISEKPPCNYSLQSLSDVYLKSDQVANTGIKGNMSNIRLFSTIALVILIVAAINYIILSTAVSSVRAKEIGIRKTFGAGIRSIKNQLFIESISLAILVLPIALILMWFAMPYAGKLFQTQLHIISSNILLYILVYLMVTIVIGIAAGIYTSNYLSKLKVSDVLKNTTFLGKKRTYIRSALIIIQLIIFCLFVSSTLIIRSQYQYALKKDPGYYNKDIVLVDLGRDFKGYSAFINNIKSNPNIIMAGGVMEGLPMESMMSSMYSNFQDNSVKVQVEGMAIDYNFLKTMGIQFIDGRDFSEEFGTDLKESVVLNQRAVKQLGIKDPLGKKLGNQTIIGVVKDFNLHSIHSDIPPLSIDMTDRYIQQVAVHFKPGVLKSILPFLESEWKKAAPDRPFSYSTIEDLIKELYSSEKNLTTIVSIFALFTLIIAALGLFGLTLFVGKSRTKEIGLKKVFGSSERKIVYSFLIENFILTSLAVLISVPLTIYFMSKWLNNFAYKTNIKWWVFLISFTIAATVVLITVFYHSYKASHINPITALRHE